MTRILASLVAALLLATTGLVADSRADTGPTADGAAVVIGDGGLPVLGAEEAAAMRLHAARALEGREQAAYLDPDAPSPANLVHPVVTRHAGTDRYTTAAALAVDLWRDVIWADRDGRPYPFTKVLVVASGQDFPDALPGGAFAAYYGGPLLLTRSHGLPGATQRAIADLAPDYIVVLGGTSAVSDDVVRQLEQHVPQPSRVVRYGGRDRYEVSANVAREIVDGAPSRRAYVALGTNWPDGLAGGAAAGWDRAPLLLTRKDGVPTVVMQALSHARPEEIVLVGGTSAVSGTVVAQLRTVAPVVRVGGADRYVVAANAAGLHATRYSATIASGQNWPDAMAGSAYAGLVGGKMLLVRASGVPGATEQAVRVGSLALIDAVGGTTSIPEPVLNHLRSLRITTPG